MKKQAKKILYVAQVAILSSLTLSCSIDPSLSNENKLKEDKSRSLPLLSQSVETEVKKYAKEQDSLLKKLEKKNPPPKLKPLEPTFNPLEAIRVSLNVDNEDAQNIFYVIADQAKMNVILAPELAEIEQRITVHLKDLPSNQVFYQVLRMLDMDGEIKNNVMMVRPFKEQIFDLEFLQTATSVDFRAGGDVFGSSNSSSGGGIGGGGMGGMAGGSAGSGGGSGGGGNSNNGMQSAFNLKGKNISEDDPYKSVEEMLKNIIGEDKLEVINKPDKLASGLMTEDKQATIETLKIGAKSKSKPIFVLNRAAGTLYVRARPSQMQIISQLIEHYKGVLDRQILIEAQILDVQLNDDFKLGVDWTLLKNRLATSYGSQIGMSATTSVLPGANMNPQTLTIPAAALGGPAGFGAAYAAGPITAAVDLMKTFGTVKVLSNPSIRVKNSQPAIVSVGHTERYIAQTTTNV